VRERILSPILTPARGQCSPTGRTESPSSHFDGQSKAQRSLRGRVVGNGRYLLLHKISTEPEGACYRARDLHAGGAETDVFLRRRRGTRTFALCRTTVVRTSPDLPNLCDDGTDDETPVPSRRESTGFLDWLIGIFRR